MGLVKHTESHALHAICQTQQVAATAFIVYILMGRVCDGAAVIWCSVRNVDRGNIVQRMTIAPVLMQWVKCLLRREGCFIVNS